MSKFNELYLKTLLKNIDIKWMNDLIILDNSLSNQLPFIFSQNKNIFEDIQCIKKFNNLWKDLILQFPSNEANYGQNILNTIFNSNKQIYTKQQFIKLIPNNWIYYNQLINLTNFNIYIYKFDFQNSETKEFSLIDNLVKFYGQEPFKFTKQKEITLIDRQLHAQAFKNLTNNTTGCVKPKITINDNTIGVLMFLNINNYQLSTINHELFHVFQELLNIHLFQQSETLLPVLTKQEKEIIKNIGLTQNKLNYYFSNHEFWNYIHNNLIDQLQRLYKFSNLSRSQFIENIFSNLQNFYVEEENELLAFLKTIFFLKNKLNCFQKIINILINHFK